MTPSNTALSSSLPDTPTVGLAVMMNDMVLVVTEDVSVKMSTIVVGTITLVVVVFNIIVVVALT